MVDKTEVAGKLVGGVLLTYEEFQFACENGLILNHTGTKEEYIYLRFVWHYEDNEIQAYLNFAKPKKDAVWHSPIVGAGAKDIQFKYLNQMQIDEFVKHGWEIEDIGKEN